MRRSNRFVGLLIVLGLAAAARGDEPKASKKVVLIAGALDKSHPAGTHEYEKSVRLLRHCLKNAQNLKGIRAEVHFQGWPEDEKTLDSADSIVVISSGSDRVEKDHPLLVGDRLGVIDRQMKRGCGLALIHWATFMPNAPAGEKVLDWIGGHFDYQSGPGPNHWASAIQHLTTTATPADPDHPACRGLKPFEVREEFYYKMRFRAGDPRLKPFLFAKIPGEAEPQVVAWGVQRDDGGRGFGFTGGHHFQNWWQPEFRTLTLNAIAWTAKLDVPSEGVISKLPSVASFDVLDPDWTPRPATGKAELWEKATDIDWVDARLRQMDTGWTHNATFGYSSHRGPERSYKGTAIRIGEGGRAAVLFDRNQLRLAAGWDGSFLHHSDRRFGLLNTPTPAGSIAFASTSGPGWADAAGNFHSPVPATAPLPRVWAKFKAMYRSGDHVALAYTIGSTEVLESPWAVSVQGRTAFRRDLEIGPHDQSLRMLVAELPGELARIEADDVPLVIAKVGEATTVVGLVGDGAKLRTAEGGRVEVEFKPTDKTRRFRVVIAQCVTPEALANSAKDTPLTDVAAFKRPGPPRWGDPIVTRGEVADKGGPYVVDTLTVPYDNPFNALMFLTGIDFLPDGRAAVSSAHGDVWLVGGIDAKLDRLTWQRFATGLYQPMGLRVVDGVIHVIERGQLTRLRDLNNDGEADVFENVNNDWHTGAGEHSFDTCLEIDPQGHFYFFKTGDTDTSTGGCLLRVEKDGSSASIFATGFRHPIGLSVGPDGTVTGADQEGNWLPATRVDIYRPGGFYGDMRAHHRVTAPDTFDAPFCWLPREVDNSAGGQVWVPKDGFGPLSGRLLHLSYGRCKAFLMLRQALDGVEQGGVADLGLSFLSGVKTGRFRADELFVVGLTGWQTSAKRDGCLQRVRYAGGTSRVPTSLSVHSDGIRLAFDRPLDPSIAGDVSRYRLARWNYRWSGAYGSNRWSVVDPEREGQDVVPVKSATLGENGRGVVLRIEDMRPVMQMQLGYNLESTEGEAMAGIVTHTVHRLAPAIERRAETGR